MPPTKSITIKGIPATMSSAFRNLVSERYSTYNVKVLNSTDYQLKMKPTDLLSLEERHRASAPWKPFCNRINGLGLTEPTVQQYGSDTDYEILVQLPGVDDPARVKELHRHRGRA